MLFLYLLDELEKFTIQFLIDQLCVVKLSWFIREVEKLLYLNFFYSHRNDASIVHDSRRMKLFDKYTTISNQLLIIVICDWREQ